MRALGARLAAAALVWAAGVVVDAAPARACAPAPREGQVVRIVDEEAIIAYDERAKIEHFIRRGTFRSSGADFGFLVPTPSQPELAETDEAVFARLGGLLVPRVVVEKRGWDLDPTALSCIGYGLTRTLGRSAAPEATAALPAAAVTVLEEKRVAGLDAAVLEANDAAALTRWLDEHGYAKGSTLTAWLEPYVAKGWKISAFKVAAGLDGEARAVALTTKALRMSFATDKPFYPYREPADQREVLPASHRDLDAGRRSLRVYYVGHRKVEGKLGEAGVWPSMVKLAEPLDANVVAALGLPGYATSERWVTAFEDMSHPRPGTDEVFFSVAQDATPVSIPPIVVYEKRALFVPLDLIAAVGIAAALFIRGRRRRARS
jgi:hypothetical protein